MARNKVQFQKGLSEVDFLRLYGSEEACRAAVFGWRWPDGFECPACGGHDHCVLDRRDLYQCNACRTQTSLTAGAIFANTKLPLTGTYRAVRKHADRTLAEFEWRFNRCYDLAAMIPRLAWAALRTPPMPYRLLKMADSGG